MSHSETDDERRVVGLIGETEIVVVANGPKAQWCADVLSSKLGPILENVQNQLNNLTAKNY